MNLSERIKQKTDQVIAKFTKPKPTPQPTHGTVTGFSQRLIQVSTSDGQQLRQQQGTRAIGVGQRVIAHDNTAVFTGEAGVLPKPGRVFIAAQPKKKFEDYYLFRYREYSPTDRALADAKRQTLVGDDIPIQSLSDGRILAYHPNPALFPPIPVKDKLLLTDGKGLAVEVPGWEITSHWVTVDIGISLDPSIGENPRVVVSRGSVLVLWNTYRLTGNPHEPIGTPVFSTTYGETHIVRFNNKLQLLGQETKLNAVYTRRSEPPFHSTYTYTSSYTLVPELDYAVYAKGLDWFPPVFMAGGLVLNQIYGSAPDIRVFPIGISRFDHYTLDKPFGPLEVSNGLANYERGRTEATLVSDQFYRPPQDNDGTVALLAALVDAPDYSSDPELGPYFDNAGIWNTLERPEIP